MYIVGQPYKRVVAMKNGSPVYEMTAIVAVHPDKLVLANGTIIDYVEAEHEGKARLLTPRGDRS